MEMATLRGDLLERYIQEVEELGDAGLYQILDKGRKWDISETLKGGGSVIFPHAYLRKCGDQIAAAVHGCLDSGADQVLALGVVHMTTDEIKRARMREKAGEEISEEPFWGVFQEVDREFSLFPFRTLWNAEIKRRGIKGPRLIERYPCLVNRAPEKLLGIEELERIAKDSLVVGTGDLSHHGIAYGTPPELTYNLGEKGKTFARENIVKCFEILKSGNYSDFFAYGYEIQSDSKDVCSILRYLLGAMSATILDLKLVDTSSNFKEDPSPSWVATSLVELKPT